MSAGGRRVVALLAAALLAMAMAVPAALGAPAGAAAVTFVRTTVDSLPGPAFGTAGDLDGDGHDELVVSVFGRIVGTAIPNGTVVAYHREPGGETFRRTTILPASAGVRFPNEPVLVDIDKDGDLDVVTPGGFFICAVNAAAPTCGYLAWWEQKADHTYAEHVIVRNGAPLFYHRPLFTDLDADGLQDLVIVGENLQGAVVQVFAGVASADRFSTTPVVIGIGGGSLPVLHDIDGDGVLDIFSGQFFQRDASAVWFKRVAPPTPVTRFGTWARYVISTNLGGVIQVAAVKDLIAQGKVTYLLSNHTNTTSGPPGTATSAIYELTPGADPRAPWTSRAVSQGVVSRADACNCGQQQGAPGVFGTGDLDSDGKTDVVFSGDGDARIFWLRNTGNGAFQTIAIAGQRGQAGGAVVTDTDVDGRSEVLFNSYEANSVELYALQPASPERPPAARPVSAPPATATLPATGARYAIPLTGLLLLMITAGLRVSAARKSAVIVWGGGPRTERRLPC